MEPQHATIVSASNPNHTVRIPCPYCSSSRTRANQKVPVLSVDDLGDRVVYKCHHCDATGAIPTRQKSEKYFANNKAFAASLVSSEKPIPKSTTNYSEDLLGYMQSRGISRTTLETAGVVELSYYIREFKREMPCFGIPYTFEKIQTGLKIRSYPEKGFAWGGGGGHCLWNIDNLDTDQPLYIVEGEMDALSLVECGVTNVVSVPNGAPGKVKNNVVDPTEDKTFGYIWQANETLKKFKKIIIACDTDVPGNALAEELARRLGRSRCWRVEFTAKEKDANAYMIEYGKSALIDALNKPSAWPIAGLFGADKYKDDIFSFYSDGVPEAESTGYVDVDAIYRVAVGELTLVTGIPGSGKSEFIDQIMVNLAMTRDWKFAICSFENKPTHHIIKLMEKYKRKSFFDSSRRMTEAEAKEAFAWVEEHFLFIEQSSETRASVDSILERASAAVARIGVRGVVIDPYNYLEKSKSESETDSVASILTTVRQFSIANGVHSWFIAHPQKLARDSAGNVYVPKGYDVSGSANFFNIPDMGITVHRKEDHVELHNWKTRTKWFGQVGVAKLHYDKEISCYEQATEEATKLEAEEWKRKLEES